MEVVIDVLYWRDIPQAVKLRSATTTITVDLDPAFARAARAAARVEPACNGDCFQRSFRWARHARLPYGPADQLLAAALAAIEAAHAQPVLDALVANRGYSTDHRI